MDVVSALQTMPRFKELYTKGKNRTKEETEEFTTLIENNSALKDIRRFEEYRSLLAQAGKSTVQDAGLANFELSYPNIVRAYNNRVHREMLTGKGRSRRRLTRRRRTTRKRR